MLVYVYMLRQTNVDTMTHKNENSISILLPTLNHLSILILCSLGVYGEEGP